MMKMMRLFSGKKANGLTFHPASQRVRTTRLWVIAALGLGLGCLSGAAQALVTLEYRGTPISVTGRVNLRGNTAIGSPISPVYSSNSPISGTATAALPGLTGSYVFTIGSPPVYGNDVYATNVPGIGVRYTLTLGSYRRIGSSLTGPHTIQNGTLTWTLEPDFTDTIPPFTFQSSIQFIKTGTINGSIAVNRVPPVRVATTNHTPATVAWNDLYSGVANINYINHTCTVPVPPTVTLARVPSSAFTGVGSSAAETPFSISATNCTGDVQFKLSFNAGINFQDPSISLLQNTFIGSFAATGYGIQIVEANRDVINASTRTFESTVDGRSFSRAFLARYYRHAANATTGRVHAALVYTLDYY